MHLELLFSTLLAFLQLSYGLPDEPEIDGYQTILRRTANHGDKLQIFQSIWGAIRSDFPNDTDKAKNLYAQLGHFIVNEMQGSGSSSRTTASELQQEVRRHLRTLMAQRLANLLNAEENIGSYGMYIASSVEPQLVRDILNLMIEDIYFHRPLSKLLIQLEHLHIDRDEVSYRMMIEAQMALYWRYRQLADDNESYIFSVAHLLNKIQLHPMYRNADPSLRRRVVAMQESLPPALGNLFNSEGFCLMNRQHNAYIYTTISDEFNYGINGRQVFLWHEQNYTDSAGLMRAFVEEESKQYSAQYSSPIFTLRGELYKWYFFVDPSQGNRLAALRTGTPSLSSSYWSINFHEDSLILRQRDLTLCAEEWHDKERRLIKILPGQLHTPPSEVCQWRPIKCAMGTG